MKHIEGLRRRSRGNIDPLKPIRIAIWAVSAFAVAVALALALIYVAVPYLFWSSMDTPQPSDYTLDDIRKIVSDSNLQIPPSARELDAFQSGFREQSIWVRMAIPVRDLRTFTQQKLLAGKWKNGKKFDDLPELVARRWDELPRPDSGGWHCWDAQITRGANHDEAGGLAIAFGPPSMGQVIVYMEIVQ